MKQLTTMNDERLQTHIEQLQRDVHDFRERAARVASKVSCEGRETGSDPLYQRLASIRVFLQSKLKEAEQEFERRAHERAKQPAISLGAALLEWCLPWRRARATR